MGSNWPELKIELVNWHEFKYSVQLDSDQCGIFGLSFLFVIKIYMLDINGAIFVITSFKGVMNIVLQIFL